MIGWEYPPILSGGLGIACRGLATALANRGHKIFFLVPRLSGNEERVQNLELIDVKSGLEYLSAEEQEMFISQIPARREEIAYSAYASSEYKPLLKKRGYSETDVSAEGAEFLHGGYGGGLYNEVHLYSQFVSLFSKHIGFDIVHTHDWMTYPAGITAMYRTRKPLICHVHATEFDRSGDHVNQYVYNLEREAFDRCTKIVTVSNYTKNIVVNRYGVTPDKVEAIHNAVDFEMHDYLEEERRPFAEKIVLFLGRITFQKGPDYFVYAAKKVIEKIQNVRFVMVGTGDMYHRIIELAADMGIGKYFHYTGFLNRDQVQKIFRLSDLYVMPSVSEPFGISPLEAMLHGIPVIVSKQSGVSEIINHAIKVDFWDVDDIANNITHILSNPEVSNRLRWNGKSEVASITWNDAAQRMESVYYGLKG
jgi:glycosyltransferase involved in cell wall biosynthesis